MASWTRDGDGHDGEIRLWQEDDWWIATDVETGVTTQDKSRTAALESLDEAVALHAGEGAVRRPTRNTAQRESTLPTTRRASATRRTSSTDGMGRRTFSGAECQCDLDEYRSWEDVYSVPSWWAWVESQPVKRVVPGPECAD